MLLPAGKTATLLGQWSFGISVMFIRLIEMLKTKNACHQPVVGQCESYTEMSQQFASQNQSAHRQPHIQKHPHLCRSSTQPSGSHLACFENTNLKKQIKLRTGRGLPPFFLLSALFSLRLWPCLFSLSEGLWVGILR